MTNAHDDSRGGDSGGGDSGGDDNAGDDTTPTSLEATRTRARRTARACLQAGIDAADPRTVVPDTCSLDGDTLSVRSTDDTIHSIDLAEYDRVLVLGGGNAAGRAAAALESVLGDRIDEGLVVTDTPGDTEVVDQLPGDHPIPSQRGVESTTRLQALGESATEDTLVICLVTGGGSALLPAPAVGVDLADIQAVTDALLRSGAPIEDVNAVRKHLSDVKGGRLAETLAPARVLTLLFSDVVGTPVDVIASGPTVPDPTTYRDALDVLERHDVDPPEPVLARLQAGDAGDYPETPDADHPAFDRTSVVVLADNYTACDAARQAAESRDYESLVLTTRVTGSARDAARWHTAIAAESRATGNPLVPPAVIVTGGETTVEVGGDGRGGPNHEFALAAARDVPESVVLGAVDTDGIDGNSGAAGAIVDWTTLGPGEREAAATALDENDSHGFLMERDAVIETGPTGTNVNDLRVLVIEDVSDADGPDRDA